MKIANFKQKKNSVILANSFLENILNLLEAQGHIKIEMARTLAESYAQLAKDELGSQAMVAHTFNPSTQEAEAGKSL